MIFNEFRGTAIAHDVNIDITPTSDILNAHGSDLDKLLIEIVNKKIQQNHDWEKWYFDFGNGPEPAYKYIKKIHQMTCIKINESKLYDSYGYVKADIEIDMTIIPQSVQKLS